MLPPELHDWIVDSLRGGWRLEAVFDSARQWILKGGPSELPTLGADEQEAAAYWERFDKITESLEDRYLAYIEKVSADLFERILDNPQDTSEIGPAFDRHLADFQAALVGSADEPGLLAKLHSAGQAAGAYLLAGSGKGATPARAAVDVDFKARFDQAVNYARFQSAQLVTNINSGYRFGIMQAVAKAIEESWPRDRLYRELTKYLTPPGEKPSKQITARAKVIGDTEKIMSYNAGALEQFKAGGVKRAKWSTVSVGEPRICKICSSLHGLEADIDQGWYSERTKKFYKLSAHPRCRCFRVPVKRAIAPAKEAEQRIEDDPDSLSLQQALQVRAVEYERLADQLTNVVEAAKAKTKAARLEYEKASDRVWNLKNDVDDAQRALLKTPFTNREKPFGGPEWRAWRDIEDEISYQAAAALEDFNEKNKGGKNLKNRGDKFYLETKARLTLEAQKRPEYAATFYPDYWAKRQAFDLLNEQLAEAEKESKRLFKKYDKAIVNETQEQRKLSIEALTGRTKGVPVSIKADSELTKGDLSQRLKSQQEWLSRAFSKPLENVTTRPVKANVIPLNEKQRAYAYDGEIFLTPNDVKGGRTVIHEYAHIVEYGNARVHERCVEFLLNRAQDRTLHKLSDLTGDPEYADHEVAYKGNYVHPYVGKVYKWRGYRNSTEVLSMGLERLYADPIQFRKDDPGYFDFIVMMIRDYL